MDKTYMKDLFDIDVEHAQVFEFKHIKCNTEDIYACIYVLTEDRDFGLPFLKICDWKFLDREMNVFCEKRKRSGMLVNAVEAFLRGEATFLLSDGEVEKYINIKDFQTAFENLTGIDEYFEYLFEEPFEWVAGVDALWCIAMHGELKNPLEDYGDYNNIEWEEQRWYSGPVI